ncbi:MAG: type II secretion system F family protein [Ignavibacteriales bacterium]|nr:type II secretion system F family protein [Ignavibacteriales bacterium]
MPPLSASEYRIQATDQSGRPIQRYITSVSLIAARKKAGVLAKTYGWKKISVSKKKSYSYRVTRGGNQIDGVQSAYSKDEVVTALEKIGFTVKSVNRFYDVRFAAASDEVVTFIGTSAKLLEQKLPYNEILVIMAAHVRDKNLRGALKAIIRDLKDGVDSRDAFLRQGKVIGHDTALMLGIASKSGDMKAIFESVAHFVERQADFKKGLVSSMIMPAVTALALIGALLFYVMYLLPRMVEMLAPVMGAMPPLTAFTMATSDMLRENLILIITVVFAALGSFYAYIMTTNGAVWFDKWVIRLPYVGRILKNTSSELFCRVLGILYTSGENIDAIQHAAEACRNRYLERQMRTVAVPTMLKYGTEFWKAMEMTNFFPEMIISRFRTAAETGSVKVTAVQLADYYEMENRYAMKNLVNVIEVGVSIVIMVAMVFLTMLSSETASIKIEPKRDQGSTMTSKPDTIIDMRER